MELRALRCFVAVAEERTVTAGADRLAIGQPAVSRQIQQLERQLRIKLFDREEGRLRLTAAGSDVLPVARQLLRQADEVVAAAGGAASGRLRRVRMAAATTTRDDVLAPWLATRPAEAPVPSVVDAPVDDIYRMLRRGCDLAVSPVAPPPRLAHRPLARLPLWAYVGPAHPWARRESVDLAELAEADLLLLEPGFHARRAFDVALDTAGLGVEPLAEFGSPVVAQAVAATGRGVCVLTDDPRFDLVPLLVRGAAGEWLGITLHAAWDAGHHAAPALSEIVEDLARFTVGRYGAWQPPASGDAASRGEAPR